MARHDWEGIYALPETRAPRDVRGQRLPVRFEIVDKRIRPAIAEPLDADGKPKETRGPYTVFVTLQVLLATCWHFSDTEAVENALYQAKPIIQMVCSDFCCLGIL